MPLPPEKPFICHEDIVLSENEIKILSRGPNFMLRDELDREMFYVNLEKMVTKKKYNSAFNEMEDDLTEEDTTASSTSADTNQTEISTKSRNNNNIEKSNTSKNDQIWEEQSGKMVYNSKLKSLDFGNFQASSYKYNKHVFMPKSESPEIETLHEVRRSEMKRIFERAISNPTKTNNRHKGSDLAATNRGNDCLGPPSKNPKNQNVESNLSKEELIGLKSLKKRIADGQIVVVQTDKSKRFSVMTKQQYIESGLVHTNKDIKIEPENVKRIQNVVNSHVWWLKECTNIGRNWGHEDRMSQNLLDKGEQSCMMSLLTKDHKKWSFESGEPIPSRPVISGNTGLNCHLSELISNIIEPVAYEQEGRDIDSTDDMICKIHQLNSKLANEKPICEQNVICEGSTSTNVENFENEEKIFQTNSTLNNSTTKRNFSKGDIRYFGRTGEKTCDSKCTKERLREQIESLQLKRAKGSVIPDVKDRMRAGRLLDKILGEVAIPLPCEGGSSSDGPRQKSSGLAIVGSDVKSLFPSLRAVETARLARYAIENSEIEFSNWDYKKSLRYLCC